MEFTKQELEIIAGVVGTLTVKMSDARLFTALQDKIQGMIQAMPSVEGEDAVKVTVETTGEAA
jgi:hypothetical protein